MVAKLHRVKTRFHSRSAGVIAVFMGMACTIAVVAQAPHTPQGATSNASITSEQNEPDPVNLKVLPKNLSGRQVRDIMKQWSAELGVRCSACHVTDSGSVVSARPAEARFADDSRQMKKTARLMYTMTDQLNVNFVAKVEGAGIPVTCGTCHRGNISPEPFVSPADQLRTQALPPAEKMLTR